MSWIQHQNRREFDIPDLNLGGSKLRLEQAEWGLSQAFVRFSPPGIRIFNRAQRELNYQIRTVGSPWSETYTLPAGESHRFDGAQDFEFRENTSESGQPKKVVTIPVGTDSEYKILDGDSSPSFLTDNSAS